MHRISNGSTNSVRSPQMRGVASLAMLCVALLTLPCGGAAAAQTDGAPVLLSTLETTQAVIDEYAVWGVVPTPMLPQSGIDPYGNGAYETPALLESWVDTHIPPDYDGYLIVDWREGVTEPLLAGSGHERFDSVVAAMVSVVDELRRRRPQAQIGFVGIPVFDYWSHGDAWRAALAAAAPLHEAVDAFFPDVRDVYGTEPERDLERLSAYVAATLEIAAGRPVFLYTSHRYENVTERWGYGLIGHDEYVAHISGLMSVEHEGRRPAGAVAAGNEYHTFLAGASLRVTGGYVRTDPEWERVRSALAIEARDGETIDGYLERLHPYVLCILNEAVRGEVCALEAPSPE